MTLVDLIAEEHPEWDRYDRRQASLLPPYFIDPEQPTVRILVFKDFVRVTTFFEGFHVSIPAADPQFFIKIRKAINQGCLEWKKNWSGERTF